MSTTAAQRQASLKARRKAAGLVQVKVWVHPDWREHIKREAADRQNEAPGLVWVDIGDLSDLIVITPDECDQLL